MRCKEYRSRRCAVVLLVVTDKLTSFTKLYPMVKEDALSTSDALQDWISTFGKPDFLMSDGGPAFRNLVISSLTSALKIDHHFVTAYSSWANGKQERLNYTIGKAFRALLSENLMSTTHWHLLVPIVQSVINQTPVASLSWVSPAQAFLACEQANPISSFTDDQGILRHVAWEKSEFLSKVKEWQEEATAREAFLHETQVQRNAKLIERQAAKGRAREFVGEVGDYVMVRKPKKHLSKLERRWRGPAQIISFDEEAPKFVLVVRYLGEHGRRSPTEKVHVDRVRFFDLASMIVTEELKTHAEATSDLRYDVERFNDVRWSNKKKCFELEVYWEGYEDPTWEPLGRMREDVPDMVQNFLATGVPAKSQHLLTEIMRDVGAHTRLVKKKGSVAGTEPEPVSM